MQYSLSHCLRCCCCYRCDHHHSSSIGAEVFRAVLAHPPNTINGRFRVTEQGEMITQNFGSTGIAERTMDIYTAAVLAGIDVICCS